MVERHVGLARRVAQRVDEADDLERVTDGQLDVVCFRYRLAGVPEDELDALNQRLGEAVLTDGRVYVGTTTYGGRVAFRPAIVNYRSREADVDLLVDVIRELGASLHGGGASRVAASRGCRSLCSLRGSRFAQGVKGKGKRTRVLLDWRTPFLVHVSRLDSPTYRLPTSDSHPRRSGRALNAN